LFRFWGNSIANLSSFLFSETTFFLFYFLERTHMLKSLTKSMLVLAFAAFISIAPAHADATPEEAQAMAEKAEAYVKEHGKDAATAEFNKAQSDFIKDDLYVWVIDAQGVFLAHPIKPAMIGKNMIDMKDVDGTPLIKLFTEVKDRGWVPYKWPPSGLQRNPPEEKLCHQC
jgi:cytochrome c